MAPECLAALTSASRVAAPRAARSSSTGASPTTTGSTRNAWSASTSDTICATSPAQVPPSRTTFGSYSHARSSRSWLRASRLTACGSSAWRWMSASVCSTESWRCAATAARSSERTRADRSSARESSSRRQIGAVARTTPVRMTRVAAKPLRALAS
ncbi:hypothetical protein [Blastococcus brunescens]|uniref:Uncharacterized protein n=1 Tax=Blastococcus brunescens TaxID=1564165 RepID=A0ABZ1AWU9_9ACTN|nr:hypothetical protein [Blastococcus sp. BMG 8361]WRL63030.1 hypothetical protein U6N30_24765 [Blastococcus sp. BMG 8361]